MYFSRDILFENKRRASRSNDPPTGLHSKWQSILETIYPAFPLYDSRNSIPISKCSGSGRHSPEGLFQAHWKGWRKTETLQRGTPHLFQNVSQKNHQVCMSSRVEKRNQRAGLFGWKFIGPVSSYGRIRRILHRFQRYLAGGFDAIATQTEGIYWVVKIGVYKSKNFWNHGSTFGNHTFLEQKIQRQIEKNLRKKEGSAIITRLWAFLN